MGPNHTPCKVGAQTRGQLLWQTWWVRAPGAPGGVGGGWSYLGALGLRSSCFPRCMESSSGYTPACCHGNVFYASAPQCQTLEPHRPRPLVMDTKAGLVSRSTPRRHPTSEALPEPLRIPRGECHGPWGQQAAHLVLPTPLLPNVEGNAVGLLLGADQVDIKRNEELPCPRGRGPPAGDKGAGAEVGRPLGLLELWGDSP